MFRNKCPICGESANIKRAFNRDFNGMKTIVPFQQYDVLCCQGCGMVYAGNILPSMPLLEYYDLISKYETDNYKISEAAWREYHWVTDFLKKMLSDDLSILDVGCGPGSTLSLLKKAGFTDLTGIEVSHKNIRFIQEKYGIPAYVGSTENLSAVQNRKFDVVLLEGVLEHILPLREAVKNVSACLSAKGYLCIVVPDIERFFERNNLYQEFSSEHVNFFSITTLNHLLCEQGYCYAGGNKCNGSSITLWCRTGGKTSVTRSFDEAGVKALEQYLHQCNVLSASLRGKMNCMHEGYIWGAGTHTAMLYQLHLLDRFEVKGIIDSNLNYAGRVIYAHRVMKPEELSDETTPILISSQYAQDAIEAYIRGQLKRKNPILKLY